jgi:hypothetical protein
MADMGKMDKTQPEARRKLIADASTLRAAAHLQR